MFLVNTTWGTTYFLTDANKGSAHLPGSWNTSAAGAGIAATNFTTAGDIFNIPTGIVGVATASFTIGTNVETTFQLQISGSLTLNTGVILTLAQKNAGNTTLLVNSGGLIIFSNTAAQIIGLSAGSGSASNSIFTLSSGATLATSNLSGIRNVELGSISATTITSTLATGANYTFSGAGTQAITGMPTTVNNLTLSGTSSITLLAAQTVSGALNIGVSTTLTAGAFALTVTGATTLDGTLTLSSATGAKTFTGLVTINNGGTWSNSGNVPVVFKGGISNSGNFTAGTGQHTFSINNQSLSGIISIPRIRVLSSTILTNLGTLTIGTDLTGTGQLIQGASSILNIGGTVSTITLDASTNVNNVNYSGSGVQTVFIPSSNSYSSLTISGTSIINQQGDLTISGNLTIGLGATDSIGAYALTVMGTTTVNGTLKIGSSTGIKTFTGLVTINNDGIWNNSGNSPISLKGGISNTGTFTAGSGVHSFNTNNQSLLGTFSIPSITVTSVALTNGGTLTVVTSLAGTGQLIQGAGAILNNQGTATISSLDASTNVNTISYNSTASQTLSNLPTSTYSNLIFGGSGALTISYPLVIKGNFTNNATGSVNFGSNSLTFNGSSSQNIAGTATTALNSLLIANTSGVTITNNTTVTIADSLSITSGVLTNAGSLTLLSTATKTARVLQGNSTTPYLSGNVTVQRYIRTLTGNGTSYGNRKFFFVAAPIGTPASFSSTWQNQIHITGPGAGGTVCGAAATTGQPTSNNNGFDATLVNINTVFKYDDNQSLDANKWTGIANTKSTNLNAGEGYRVLIRGPRADGCALLNLDPSVASADVTLSFTGPVKQGDFTYTLNATGANQLNLIGNPYPSEFNFAAFYATNSSKIYNKYWTYYPKNAAGTYSTYSKGTMTNIGVNGTDSAFNNPDIIASGQSFLIADSTQGATTVSFLESHKSATPKYGIFGVQNENPTWNKLIRVTMRNNVTKFNLDEVVIRFGSQVNQSNVYNASWDAFSYNTGNQVLQTLKQDLPLAIQTRNQSFSSDTVHISVQSASNGNFSLNFSEFDLTKYAEIYLLDAYSKTVHKVNDNPVYNFEVNTSATKSQGKDRFTLIFQQIGSKAPGLLPVLTSTGTSVFTIYPNPVTDVVTIKSSNPIAYIKVVNAMGSAVENLTKEFGAASKTNQVNMNIGNLKAGYYFLQIVDITGAKATKKVIKN